LKENSLLIVQPLYHLNGHPLPYTNRFVKGALSYNHISVALLLGLFSKFPYKLKTFFLFKNKILVRFFSDSFFTTIFSYFYIFFLGLIQSGKFKKVHFLDFNFIAAYIGDYFFKIFIKREFSYTIVTTRFIEESYVSFLKNKNKFLSIKLVINKFCFCALLQRNNIFIVHSIYHKDIIKKYNSQINVFFIPWGIEPCKTRNYVKKDNIFTWLFFGIAEKRKGIYEFLKFVRSNKLNDKVLIVGKFDSDYYLLIQKFLLTFKLRNVEIINSFIDESDISNVFARADCLVLNYIDSFNGASGALTEAVRFNLPILSTNHGEHGSIVSDNHLGETYSFGNFTELAYATKKLKLNIKKNKNFYSKYLKKYLIKNSWEKVFATHAKTIFC
jgi:glycosyltransferase involved in cell wall biosynthesis